MGNLRDILFYSVGGAIWRLSSFGLGRGRYPLRQTHRLELFREIKLLVSRNLPLSEGLERFSRRSKGYFQPLEIGFILVYFAVLLFSIAELSESAALFPLMVFIIISLPLVLRFKTWACLVLWGICTLAFCFYYLLFPEQIKQIMNMLSRGGTDEIREQTFRFIFMFLVVIFIIVSRTYGRIDVKLRVIARELEKGKPLSQVLKETISNLSRFHIALLRNGEKSGNLARSLDSLIEYEKVYKAIVFRQILYLVFYPLVLLFFSLLIYFVLMTKISPKLEDLARQTGVPFPELTRAVMKSFHILFNVDIGYVIIFVFLATLFFVFLMPTLINFIPFFRKINHRLLTAKFFGLLGYAFQSGIPVDEALHLSIGISGRDTWSGMHLARMKKKIVAGEKISKAFQSAPVIRKEAAALARVAEDAGILEHELIAISDQQFTFAFNEITRFGMYLEPILHIVIAGIIAIIVISMYRGLFALTTLSGVVT